MIKMLHIVGSDAIWNRICVNFMIVHLIRTSRKTQNDFVALYVQKCTIFDNFISSKITKIISKSYKWFGHFLSDFFDVFWRQKEPIITSITKLIDPRIRNIEAIFVKSIVRQSTTWFVYDIIEFWTSVFGTKRIKDCTCQLIGQNRHFRFLIHIVWWIWVPYFLSEINRL